MANTQLTTQNMPLLERVQIPVPAVAITTDLESPIWKASFAGTILSVYYVVNTTLTGAATNYRTVTLYNRGAAGAGTAAAATLAFSSGGVVATANIPKAITLSGTAANLVVADGDILTLNSLHTASGIADPGGLIIIEISRN